MKRALLSTAATTTATKRRRLPLSETLCAVSVFAEGGSDASYSEVVRRLQALGARHSGAVHKRVSFLVATAEAARSRTQRIRKALKYKVPIVSVAFLDECEASGERPSSSNFLIDVEPGVACTPVVEKTQNTPPKPKERIVLDLGCCCACHDDGAESCEWCEQYHRPTFSSAPPEEKKEESTSLENK